MRYKTIDTKIALRNNTLLQWNIVDRGHGVFIDTLENGALTSKVKCMTLSQARQALKDCFTRVVDSTVFED